MTEVARVPVVSPLSLSREIAEKYHNRSVAAVNDHEIRMSVMTERFAWHRHPDSDETFLGVDGEIVIEFEDGEVILGPGDMVTVPSGILHRTRPHGHRSVNLTFERVGASTIFEEPVQKEGGQSRLSNGSFGATDRERLGT